MAKGNNGQKSKGLNSQSIGDKILDRSNNRDSLGKCSKSNKMKKFKFSLFLILALGQFPVLLAQESRESQGDKLLWLTSVNIGYQSFTDGSGEIDLDNPGDYKVTQFAYSGMKVAIGLAVAKQSKAKQ